MTYSCDTTPHYTYSYELFYDTQTCDKCPLFLNRDIYKKYDDLNTFLANILFLVLMSIPLVICMSPPRPQYQYQPQPSVDNPEKLRIQALETRMQKVEEQLKSHIQKLEKQLNDLEDHVMMYCIESN